MGRPRAVSGADSLLSGNRQKGVWGVGVVVFLEGILSLVNIFLALLAAPV